MVNAISVFQAIVGIVVRPPGELQDPITGSACGRQGLSLYSKPGCPHFPHERHIHNPRRCCN
ncbi:hypothetical protein L9W92_17000 [Pelotomaculum terephthalicicum JT]|uniref:hypothetical protein n=1 Tax=Pelotomaculum terephthalicicum TaxID=206393 RepID=UPI001F04038D|nr:hypothetical protein [Pelotomaculum terephthalicicum]MCG9969702.1 hypothetical protein [Pelotomaculum terephthalicicum JT]